MRSFVISFICHGFPVWNCNNMIFILISLITSEISFQKIYMRNMYWCRSNEFCCVRERVRAKIRAMVRKIRASGLLQSKRPDSEQKREQEATNSDLKRVQEPGSRVKARSSAIARAWVKEQTCSAKHHSGYFWSSIQCATHYIKIFSSWQATNVFRTHMKNQN